VVTLRVAYEDKEQPPYYLGVGTAIPSSKPGISVDIVKMLEKKIPQLKIDFVRVPWARCTAGLGTNTYDAIFNSSYTPDRLSIGWYPTTNNRHDGPVDTSKRITTIQYSLYTLDTTKLSWDGKAFSDPTVLLGAPAGYSIVNDLKKIGMAVHESPASTNALDMLLAGRFPGAVLQDVTADAIIAKNTQKFSKIVKSPKAIVSKEYYLMLSKDFVSKHPDLSRAIWKAIEELRLSEFAKLTALYAD
jgi:polar amino acid transport system substrate-binding protein